MLRRHPVTSTRPRGRSPPRRARRAARPRPVLAPPGAHAVPEAHRSHGGRRGIRRGARQARRRADPRDGGVRLRGGRRGPPEPDRRPRLRPSGGLRARQPRGQGDDRRQGPVAREHVVHLPDLRPEGVRPEDARGASGQDDRLRGSLQHLGLRVPDGHAHREGARPEQGPQDVLQGVRVLGVARRGSPGAPQRPRRRLRLVRPGARAVPEGSGRSGRSSSTLPRARRFRRAGSARATGSTRRWSRRCARRSCR